MTSFLSALAGLLLVSGAPSPAPKPTPAPYIAEAIADPARPLEQVARDSARKPAEVIAFTALKPGDRVADFMSGGAYFTRLFSLVVGPAGRVYAFLPQEELNTCSPEEVAGTRAVEHDRAYANVTVLTGAANSFGAPERLDLVFTSQNYHDLHDAFMSPTRIEVFNRRVFDALKPGGAFVVIDHVAEPGSELRDTGTLHRIDPEVIIREVQAAGFVLAAESQALRNTADTHLLRVFDPRIRGRTDQVILLFRKPA